MPDYPEAFNGLAVALLALGQVAEAEANLQVQKMLPRLEEVMLG